MSDSNRTWPSVRQQSNLAGRRRQWWFRAGTWKRGTPGRSASPLRRAVGGIETEVRDLSTEHRSDLGAPKALCSAQLRAAATPEGGRKRRPAGGGAPASRGGGLDAWTRPPVIRTFWK